MAALAQIYLLITEYSALNLDDSTYKFVGAQKSNFVKRM